MNLYENEILTITVSSLIALGIGLLIRYGLKPKFEIIYDENRKANFTYLFNGINAFDFNFERFYNTFENRLGLLTREREEIVSFPVFVTVNPTIDEKQIPIINFREFQQQSEEFATVKEELKPVLQWLRDNVDAFSKYYNLYQSYMHDSFLRIISLYFADTVYYAEWLLNGYPLPQIAYKRLDHAFKIIKYLEDDNSIDKTIPSIKEFIKKWRDYKLQN